MYKNKSQTEIQIENYLLLTFVLLKLLLVQENYSSSFKFSI